MNALLLLLALGAYKPNFDEAYFDKCYDGESADTCSRRQARWREDMERYRAELAEEAKRELEYVKKDADELKVEPEAGREKVAPLAPSWCKGARAPEDLSGLRAIARNITNFNEGRYFSFTPALYAAQAMCIVPDNGDVKRLAGALVQSLVNTIGYSSADAVADLTLRLDEERFAKAKKTLCEELKVSEEAEGLAKAQAAATFHLFGCGERDKTDVALWLDAAGLDTEATVYFLDSGLEVPSETMRLAWLLANVSRPEELAERPWRVILHPMIQPDLDAFDVKKLEKELSEAPFAGNPWAKAVLLESLGWYRAKSADYLAAIAKLTKKDEGWKELLLEAPKRALKDWSARTAQFKDALTRSAEFEAKAFGPSRKAAKGCSAALRKDFGAFLKSVKAPAKEFSQAVVGDPVGNVLLLRLAACEAAEGHGAFAGLLKGSWEEGRVMRGQRFAAMYGAIEALGEVKKDRPKFPLEPSQGRVPRNDELLNRFEDGIESMPVKSYGPEAIGSVVKSITRQGDKVKVVFITEKFTRPAHDCWDTNKIMGINSDGTIRYYRNCTFGKRMETITLHLDDAVFPADLAAGIKPGTWVDVARNSNSAMPLAVYADKSQQKLLAWRGFGL
jgi:hypothetical protein